MNSDNTLLIADIGGTNARFALTGDNNPAPFYATQTFQCADYNNAEQAIDHYLSSHNIANLKGICFAVAAPIQNQSASFTNNHWHIQCAELRQRYKIDDVRLINDFESISYSLPLLKSTDLIAIGGDWEPNLTNSFTVGVVGPGSGLGVGGLVGHDGGIHPLVTEGGHIGFAPANQLQQKILAELDHKYDRVSNERLLSGSGLTNIHEALCQIEKQENPGLSPSDIAIAGTQGNDPLCKLSVDTFFEILGQVASDIALAFGANAGIFIAGGIVQRYPEQFAKSQFRRSFENKGRYSSLMKNIPTWLVTHKNPGLFGCSVAAQTH